MSLFGGGKAAKKQTVIEKLKHSSQSTSDWFDMQTIDQALDKLERFKFCSSFYLTKKEQLYFQEKGMAVMRSHAEDFVRQKLVPADPINDGKQKPMHGHPVFKAMHATAYCCRGCLNKWYKVPLHRELSPTEQEKIVKLLMAWIERQKKSSLSE